MHELPDDAQRTAPSVDVRWPRPGVAQVILCGEHDLSSVDRLSETLAATLGGCSKLVVDLRETQYIDSSTIRVLVSTRKQTEAEGRHFALVLATTPIVEKTLEITGVLGILNRVQTLEEALGQRAGGHAAAGLPSFEPDI
jgi:anti-anti-sigma factor